MVLVAPSLPQSDVTGMRNPTTLFGFQTWSFFSILSLLLVVVLLIVGPIFFPPWSGNVVITTSDPIAITAISRLNNTTVHHVPKASQLHLLISITSGPAHASLRMAARESWLIPCMRSAVCDYRFFCDIVEGNVTEVLATEQEEYHDLVFRGPWCRFMHERHHPSINYGNYMDGFGAEKFEVLLPDYHLRLLYKVDWKVCFTKWAVLYDKLALYHAYVEDDSFNCIDNLLHQIQILHTLNTSTTITTTTSTNSSNSSNSNSISSSINGSSISNKNGQILPLPPLRAGFPMYGPSSPNPTPLSPPSHPPPPPCSSHI